MIESTRNARVVKAARLKRTKARREAGRMLLEGPNLVGAALAAETDIDVVFALPDDEMAATARGAGIEAVEVAPAVMAKLADTGQPRGPVAVAVMPASAPIRRADTIVLCAIRDPGNVGTLIRSAVAFGFQVVAAPGTVDVWSPKVLRSGAGAHFSAEIVTDAEPSTVAAAGVSLVALVAHGGGTDIEEESAPIGLLIGNEAHGLDPQLIRLAASSLTIPTSGSVESLNAAVAGSIAMFAVAQGRS